MSTRSLLALLGGVLVCAACGSGSGDPEPWVDATVALSWTIDGGPASAGCASGVTIGLVNLSLPQRAPDASDEALTPCRDGTATLPVLALPGSNRLFVNAKGDVGEARLLSGEYPVTFDAAHHAVLAVDLRHAVRPDAMPLDAAAGPDASPDATPDAL